ncbi:hypothetical protein DW257_10395 [Catenibacterium sp. AM22-15]|uniref:hypothetical protein n=1 Tax=unclassified Catenibacterium TaxID=2643636 RepID=UPI000E3EE6B9|nr:MULTISPECIES: hypothetical protein [unclassified Catenibacterium]RGE93664.1 hypothetical protein DW269_10680 [Catenibacterium sp. AM22-6LB]RGF02322.1 hypothetical protein DW257_10395 [Catenibacterium sp. AM22-15]
MKQLLISNGNINRTIIIDHTKYVLGSNAVNKFYIKQAVRQYFNKTISGYREEIGSECYFKIDDNPVDKKNTFFYEVTENYSINEDAKLSTKSLMLKYLETLYSSIDYMDTLNTFNILVESLSDEVSENAFVQSEFSTYSPKLLTKLVTAHYYEDESYKDEYDLSYEDLVILQLNMINYIAVNSKKYAYIILFIDIPLLTDEIRSKIDEISNDRVYCIVFSKTIRDVEIENICVEEDYFLDFANEEMVYYILNEKSTNLYTLEDIKNMINEYLKDLNSREHISLINNLMSYYKK